MLVHILTLIIWIASMVLFAIAALTPRPVNLIAAGLFGFDLWIGLQFIMEVTDPITF